MGDGGMGRWGDEMGLIALKPPEARNYERNTSSKPLARGSTTRR